MTRCFPQGARGSARYSTPVRRNRSGSAHSRCSSTATDSTVGMTTDGDYSPRESLTSTPQCKKRSREDSDNGDGVEGLAVDVEVDVDDSQEKRDESRKKKRRISEKTTEVKGSRVRACF